MQMWAVNISAQTDGMDRQHRHTAQPGAKGAGITSIHVCMPDPALKLYKASCTVGLQTDHIQAGRWSHIAYDHATHLSGLNLVGARGP